VSGLEREGGGGEGGEKGKVEERKVNERNGQWITHLYSWLRWGRRKEARILRRSTVGGGSVRGDGGGGRGRQ